MTCTRVLAVLQDRDEDFHVWILDLDTNEWTRHAQTFAPDPLVEEFTWRNVRDLTQEQVRPDHTPAPTRLLRVRCSSVCAVHLNQPRSKGSIRKVRLWSVEKSVWGMVVAALLC